MLEFNLLVHDKTAPIVPQSKTKTIKWNKKKREALYQCYHNFYGIFSSIETVDKLSVNNAVSDFGELIYLVAKPLFRKELLLVISENLTLRDLMLSEWFDDSC